MKKKIVGFLLVFVMVFALSGCTDNNNGDAGDGGNNIVADDLPEGLFEYPEAQLTKFDVVTENLAEGVTSKKVYHYTTSNSGQQVFQHFLDKTTIGEYMNGLSPSADDPEQKHSLKIFREDKIVGEININTIDGTTNIIISLPEYE